MIDRGKAETILNGLYAALNIEGVAIRGAMFPAFAGLDVPYHFRRVREAIHVIEREYPDLVNT